MTLSQLSIKIGVWTLNYTELFRYLYYCSNIPVYFWSIVVCGILAAKLSSISITISHSSSYRHFVEWVWLLNTEYSYPKIKPYTVYLTPYTQTCNTGKMVPVISHRYMLGSFYIHSHTKNMQIQIQTLQLQMQRTRYILTCPTYHSRNRTAALHMHASCPWPQETGDNAQSLNPQLPCHISRWTGNTSPYVICHKSKHQTMCRATRTLFLQHTDLSVMEWADSPNRTYVRSNTLFRLESI